MHNQKMNLGTRTDHAERARHAHESQIDELDNNTHALGKLVRSYRRDAANPGLTALPARVSRSLLGFWRRLFFCTRYSLISSA